MRTLASMWIAKHGRCAYNPNTGKAEQEDTLTRKPVNLSEMRAPGSMRDPISKNEVENNWRRQPVQTSDLHKYTLAYAYPHTYIHSMHTHTHCNKHFIITILQNIIFGEFWTVMISRSFMYLEYSKYDQIDIIFLNFLMITFLTK